MQQKNEEGELRYKKVKGTENPADAMTKALVQADMERYMTMISLQVAKGRAEMGLDIVSRQVRAKSFQVDKQPSTKEE